MISTSARWFSSSVCWQVQEVWQHPDRLDAAVSAKRGLGGNSPFWLLNQTGVGVAIWLAPEDDVKGGNAPNGEQFSFCMAQSCVMLVAAENVQASL